MSQYIALYPDQKTVELLEKVQDFVEEKLTGADTSFIGSSKLHLTLKFIDGENIRNKWVCKQLLLLPFDLRKIQLRIIGFDVFGNCLVAKTNLNEELHKLKLYIDDATPESLGFPKSQYETYNPHITLCKDGILGEEVKLFDNLFKLKLNEDFIFDSLKFIEKTETEHKVLFCRPLF